MTGNAAEVSRRAILKISESTILTTVDGLDLRGHAKISAVVGIPLRNLQQRRDVTTFAVSAPIAAVAALLELLAMSPLEKVIVALGDHADTPNFEQLRDADRRRHSRRCVHSTTSSPCSPSLSPRSSRRRRTVAVCSKSEPEWALPELPEPRRVVDELHAERDRSRRSRSSVDGVARKRRSASAVRPRSVPRVRRKSSQRRRRPRRPQPASHRR